MRERIEAALDKVRPALRADGRDAELVDVKDSVVTTKVTGACGNCPMSTMTLRMGIEQIIRQEVPEVKKLVAV